MLCDGRVVCGCADPYAQRVLGDARRSSLHDIWTGETVSALRADLNRGGAAFCGDCPLKLPLAEGQAPPERDLAVPPLPSRLYVECTAACNISCVQACCAPETGITRTRQAGMLDVDLFTRVVDEAGPSLGRIDFFNYGEAFLHKRAVEMCEFVKQKYPHIYLYTSTNGLALTEESARRLVRSGIDEVTFSIDGASQETYARYRQRGRFDVAMANLRAMVDEKRKAGRDVPVINWRYILFTWNDSDGEMERAREMAAGMGVDRLTWEITDHPEDAFSRRFVPGTPDYERVRYEVWDTNNLGNAIPGAMPRARIDVATIVPGLPLLGAPRPGRRGAHARPQPLHAPVPARGELRPAPGAPRRAVVRCVRRGRRARLRPGVAAADHRRRRAGRRAHRDPGAGGARPLPAEVRPGQRGHRLVRSLRVRNDGEAVPGALASPDAAVRPRKPIPPTSRQI